VIRVALHTLRERTKAAVVGFLWATDDGQLKPTRVIPAADSDQILLSESLTDVVLKHSRAVWVANQGTLEPSESLREYADAICVPMIHNQQTLGAIHLYLRNGSFRQVDFDFAISLAHVVVVALARSRRQATLRVDHDRLRANSAAFDTLLGECEAMRTLKEKLSRVARATGCVLVRGESGTGKELVARAIHKLSSRADRPLLCVNCAAVPAELMESQLFGHVKGAFTSAHTDHEGWFRQADTGTLFLDEVGELTLEGQAKLLRVLEGHAFLPVGGSDEVNVDVRVIAATNRDLREAVPQKRFREDLYYRLSVFELVIPPLRERQSDVELLIDHFLNHFRIQHGRPQLQLSPAARQRLIEYAWPGNVRQLRNVIDSATVLAAGPEIVGDDLGLYDAGLDHFDTLNIAAWEERLIAEALRRAEGSVPEAAGMLGMGRATLYRKIDEYKIER
jgi:Nif-specific regulatory protein